MQKKVLIVDDSPSEVRLMHGLLEREGYSPVGLHDSARIEETIALERPNVILLDVVMPGKNGFQVCRELKGHDEFKTIPVILVTSRDTPATNIGASSKARTVMSLSLLRRRNCCER